MIIGQLYETLQVREHYATMEKQVLAELEAVRLELEPLEQVNYLWKRSFAPTLNRRLFNFNFNSVKIQFTLSFAHLHYQIRNEKFSFLNLTTIFARSISTSLKYTSEWLFYLNFRNFPANTKIQKFGIVILIRVAPRNLSNLFQLISSSNLLFITLLFIVGSKHLRIVRPRKRLKLWIINYKRSGIILQSQDLSTRLITPSGGYRRFYRFGANIFANVCSFRCWIYSPWTSNQINRSRFVNERAFLQKHDPGSRQNGCLKKFKFVWSY